MIANTNANPSTITITNIPYAEYDVVVYGHNNWFDRGTEVTVAGTGITYVMQPTLGSFDGTYLKATSTDPWNPTVGANYSVHTGVTGATCIITWTPLTKATWDDEGWVNAIQIVEMPKKSDFNRDWSVDSADLALFVQVWLNTGAGLPQDLYPDNKIDLKDFALFAEEWLEE